MATSTGRILAVAFIRRSRSFGEAPLMARAAEPTPARRAILDIVVALGFRWTPTEVGR